jgi:hypothetical protein
MKIFAWFSVITSILYFLNFNPSVDLKISAHEEVIYDNTTFFQDYKNADLNDFFEELRYLSLEVNPYSPLNSVDNLRRINDTLYIMDTNSSGKVFLYTENGEFIGHVGELNSGCSGGGNYFDKCLETNNILIGRGDEAVIFRYKSNGDLISIDSTGFYFGDFSFNSDLGRYIFNTISRGIDVTGRHSHKVILTDANFQVEQMYFPNEELDLAKEFNIDNSIQKSCDTCDFVFYADFYNGEIYELNFNGKKRLVYKIDDGFDKRDDYLNSPYTNIPALEVMMYNKRLYPFTEYYINDDFLVLFNYFEQRVRTHLVYNRKTLKGNRFPSNIPISLNTEQQFNFHFETPSSVIGDYFVAFRSAKSWNQVIGFLPDSVNISHLPESPVYGPVIKLYNYNKNVIGQDES